MAVSNPRRVLVIVAGIVLLLAGVGLGWWAWGGAAGTRDSRGTTFATLLALAGLLLTLVGWFLPAVSQRVTKGTAQKAGRGSVQAGGHITGAVATGRGATASAQHLVPPAETATDRTPSGLVEQQADRGAVQASGDITGAVATGKNARADEPSEPPDEDPGTPDSGSPGPS